MARWDISLWDDPNSIWVGPGTLSAWDGTAWRQVSTLWAWDGTAWKEVHELHVWNGNEWVPLLAQANPRITRMLVLADETGIRVQFTVNNDTQSVLVECEFFGPGGFSYGRQEVELVNTTPGGSRTSKSVTPPPDAESVTFYCTPFSGSNGTGVRGPEASTGMTLGGGGLPGPASDDEVVPLSESEGTNDDSGAEDSEDTADS